MAEVLKALKAYRRLRSLELIEMGMGEESHEVLLEALGEGCWLDLDKVDVSDNPDLLDGMKGVGLAEVLEGGGEGNGRVSRFRRLTELRVRNCGLSGEGAERLLGAIEGGACPRLRRLKMEPGVVEDEDGHGKRLLARGVWALFTKNSY